MPAIRSAEYTSPVGLQGEFTHTALTPGTLRHDATSATSSTLSTCAPANCVPISYVGYETFGCTTTSSSPKCSSDAINATPSLEPTVGTTSAWIACKSTLRAAENHSAIAARKSAVPAVAGYPYAFGSFAATASALRTESGTGSTGDPTDRSIMPPNAAFAVRLYAAIRDQSYGEENS